MPKTLKITFTVAATLFVAICCLMVFALPRVGFAQAQFVQRGQDKQQVDNQVKEKSAVQAAQPESNQSKATGVTFSNAVQSKWKVGTKIIGGRSAASNVLITLPVPADWPEQRVSFDDVVVDSFRKLDGGIHQLVVKMPRLGAREEVVVSVTCLVTTSQIDAPTDPSVFLKPKTSHRDGKPYTGVSPDINFRNAKLRAQVKELVKGKPSVWAEVESIFDWVRDEIEDTTQEPGDVVSVFRHRQGCNEDKVGLFVAMCRAHIKRLTGFPVALEGFASLVRSLNLGSCYKKVTVSAYLKKNSDKNTSPSS